MLHFLQAGPVRVRYENGFLRYLSLDKVEVLRMIYFAIRDRNWLTAKITLTNEVVEQRVDSFQISYVWQVDDLGIQLSGQVSMEGKADGTITVDFYGKAINAFWKNRIGLCVLHPIDGVLGQPADSISPDGRITNAYFPTFIKPTQPFLTIQTLRWQPASGPALQLDFEGDVFETEDQRNWTDASFKTYSTPSSQPFPVALSPGDECRQRVVFSLSKQAVTTRIAVAETDERTPAIPTETKLTRPLIGVGQRTGGPPLTVGEAALLKKLNLSHLRADVFFSLPNWQTYLANAIADAHLLSVPLELAVFFGAEPTAELNRLTRFLRDQNVSVRSIIPLNEATLTTSDKLLQALVPALRTEWPDWLIGGGTDDSFVGLNRHRFDVDPVDFLTYSINPQAHAVDDLTLRENIAGQAATVLSARQFSGGKPIHVSPVTLRPRYTTLAGTATERLNAPADPRQLTTFGADWTRQSLEALTGAGVTSITYYQSHGVAGLVNGDTAYPLFTVFEDNL